VESCQAPARPAEAVVVPIADDGGMPLTPIAAGADGAGEVVLGLAHRRPFAAGPLLGFLAARVVPGVEEVTAGTYRRSVRLPHAAGVLALAPRPDDGHVVARLRLGDRRDLVAAERRCRRLFDLDADPEAVAEVLGADPLLAPLLRRRPGLRVPGHVDGFELAVRAVLGQQVTVKGARTLAERLVRKLGGRLAAADGTLTHLFPGAEAVAADDLSGIGLTGSRIRALRALAEAVAGGVVALEPGADPAATRRALLALPGIGPWTAEYVALRALGDPDAFPLTDLGLRQALRSLGAPDGAKALAARAERWRPWRSYAALHLWAHLTSTR
jgi:AraC family transcriptional regulator, regulatory protein of adaptative response / DNA-3-methyladenine glycosylase II